VSVCVPTYNRAALLKAFLPTILSQTLRDIEIVICDNCSPDNTTDVVREFVAADARVRYYRNDANLGPFGNMNRLLQLAKGDYVCIVHDDDSYAPDFLEREAAMLDTHPTVGMVHCAVYEIDAKGDRQRTLRAYPTTRVLESRPEFVRYLQGHNVCCSSVMARRETYLSAGPFDPKYICADFLMWLKLALLADVGYIADPLLERRVHDESVTGTLNPRWWYDEFMAIFEEGLALGAKVDPMLVQDRPALVHAAATAQGQRFLIAALAASSQGAFTLARGYADVLRTMRGIGLPARYEWMARGLANPLGRALLSIVARVRRISARRSAHVPSGTMARA
jgi:hypothetical protein